MADYGVRPSPSRLINESLHSPCRKSNLTSTKTTTEESFRDKFTSRVESPTRFSVKMSRFAPSMGSRFTGLAQSIKLPVYGVSAAYNERMTGEWGDDETAVSRGDGRELLVESCVKSFARDVSSRCLLRFQRSLFDLPRKIGSGAPFITCDPRGWVLK